MFMEKLDNDCVATDHFVNIILHKRIIVGFAVVLLLSKFIALLSVGRFESGRLAGKSNCLTNSKLATTP